MDRNKQQMDMTCKTAIAVDDSSFREDSSERGTFSSETLFRKDGNITGVDTCVEFSEKTEKINKQKEELESEVTQCTDECSILDMNALMAAESLEYKKMIYSLAEDIEDVKVKRSSSFVDKTALEYSDAEDADPNLYIVGDIKSCRKQKPTAARRASFYVDKEMENMHAYYTDYSNSAVVKLIANGLMANE